MRNGGLKTVIYHMGGKIIIYKHTANNYCSYAISLQGRRKSVRKSSIRAAAIKSVVTTLDPLPILINKSIAYNMPPITTVIYGTA